MQKIKAVELFMALGLSAVVVGCNSGQPDNTVTSSSPAVTASKEGGEGGEGGSTKTTDADLNYMVSLGLMKGHMMVAKELIDQGKYKEAEPHIAHPVDELYADIAPELPKRNVKDFKASFTKLLDLLKAKPQDPSLKTLYNAAIANIDGAIGVIPAAKRESPGFVIEAINSLLTTASEEYTAAIADNKFVALVEYQDSRGFLMYSNTLYQSIAKKLDQQKPTVSKSLQAQLKALAKAWPAVTPPAAPILTPDAVAGMVEKVAMASKP